MSTVEFLRPRLRGPRFEGRAIPLEVLRDLSVLEEMVIEVARWRFLKENTDRHRSPRGFSENVELRLTGIEDGSAVLVLTLFFATVSLPGLEPNLTYYEQGRDAIISAIEAAEQDGKITDYLPEKVLSYFDRMGRSLRDGEEIEFAWGAGRPARLNRDTRRRLVLASPTVQEMTEEVRVRGSIPEMDQAAMTFQIQLPDGRRVKAPFAEQHREVVLEAFNGFRDGVRVLVQGVGKCDRQSRLQGFVSVEHVTPLDPLDPGARLDELRQLRDGWLDGAGLAPSHTGLDWLAQCFDRQFPDALALPYLYPTPEGFIRAEWSLTPREVSLAINLDNHEGEWHCLNLDTDEEVARKLSLDESASWDWICELLRGAQGDAA